jgi:hypothetical protein
MERTSSSQVGQTARASSVDLVSDVMESVKSYAVQETVGPIKGAARWVAVGLLAALCLGVASLYGALAILRLSQDLGGSALDGGLSFLHYLITVVVLSAVVGLAVSRVRRPSLAKGER